MTGIQIGNECFMKCLAPFAIVTRTFSNDTIGPVIVSLHWKGEILRYQCQGQ